MDPVVAQALAGLITAISAVLMLWASNKWGTRHEDHHEREEED